MKNDIVIIRV